MREKNLKDLKKINNLYKCNKITCKSGEAREIDNPSKEYTPIRKFYAWFGFIHILLYIGILLYSLVWSINYINHDFATYEPPSPLLPTYRQIIAMPTPEIYHESMDLDFISESDIAYTLTARVTGYNTTDAQTDVSPCIAANGSNICGRQDTVACPRNLEFGTIVLIYGKKFECVDRTALKYDGRFDINCNLDLACPALVTATTTVVILK